MRKLDEIVARCDAWKHRATLDSIVKRVDEWNESDHPRVASGEHGGEFTSGGGGGSTGEEQDKEIERMRHEWNKKIEDIGRETAQKLGFDVSKFKIAQEDRQFELNGRMFDYAGSANLESGEITLFPNKCTTATTPGVVAHEVMHTRFQSAWKKFKEDEWKVWDDYAAGTKSHTTEGGHVTSGPVRASGELWPEYKKDYPAYAALEQFLTGTYVSQLAKKDGVTDYSKEYWKKFDLEGGKSLTRFSAIHETLAEIARLEFETGTIVGAPVWQRFYRAVKRVAA
jgi:hypothetical protein